MNKGRATKDTKASDRTGRMREETAEYRQHIATGKARLPRFREKWKTVTLGDIVDIRNGGTPRTEVPSYWGGGIPWCIPTDITACRGRYLVRTKRNITPEGLARCGANLLPSGALLLCSRATIGEVKIASIPVATNQGFKSIVCSDLVNYVFLYYLLVTLKKQLINLATGSTFLEISKRSIANIRIDIPSLLEQQSIAAVLSDMDDLIGSLEAILAKKRSIKQAAMQQLITGRKRLPGFEGEWAMSRLEDLGTFTKGKGVTRADLRETGARCIRYGELYTRYENYVAEPESRISQEVADVALPVKKGDLLFAGSGETADEIGICVAYVGEEPAYAGGDIIVLRESGQNPVYLAHLLNAPVAARQKTRMAQGDAVVHIRGDHLAEVELRLPALSEQQAIAAVLSDIDAEIAALERRLDKTRAIKQGMMEQLLTASIRLPIPDEAKEVDVNGT